MYSKVSATSSGRNGAGGFEFPKAELPMFTIHSRGIGAQVRDTRGACCALYMYRTGYGKLLTSCINPNALAGRSFLPVIGRDVVVFSKRKSHWQDEVECGDFLAQENKGVLVAIFSTSPAQRLRRR
jgi:hypothetical protein